MSVVVFGRLWWKSERQWHSRHCCGESDADSYYDLKLLIHCTSIYFISLAFVVATCNAEIM